MLKQYPKFKVGQIETIFKKLPKTEQKLIQDYLFYRQASGLSDVRDLRRYLIQIRQIIQIEFKDFNKLEQHAKLSVLIKNSHLSNEVKKNLRININNFFGEYLLPNDWTAKFKRVYSNKNGDKGEGSENTNIKNIPTDEEVEKMLKTEHTTYWKTFLLIQANTGLRTIECRLIEIKKIKFSDDETAEIHIYMTKTGKDKVVFPNKQTTDHIKKLIEEYENTGQLGKYLFPSPTDLNKPVDKNRTNRWFRNLSFKATGKHYINYSLRHKKSTELYELANKNIIAENTALKILGHAKSMKEKYVHTPKDEEIQILKEQAFNTEISEDERKGLIKEIEELKKETAEIKPYLHILKAMSQDYDQIKRSNPGKEVVINFDVVAK